MSSSGILGLVMGTLLSGKFVRKGRRLSAIWLSLLVIASSALQIVWLSVIPICAGRLLFGFASGALVTCANCMLKETVPDSQKKTFCVTVNFGIELGLMICLFVGMPLTDLTLA
jgi:MFS family permease